MELLAAQHTDEGTIRITLAHAGGLESLEGSPDEVEALCTAMETTCLFALAADHERAWLSEMPVGRDVVRLGLSPGGRVRFLIVGD